MIKTLINRLIPGKIKKSIRDSLGVPTQEASLSNIRRLGFNPGCCLDIGAYQGEWTCDFKQIFPDCAVLMLEGQEEKESYLKTIKNTYSHVDYRIALLGAGQNTVVFHKYESGSSVLKEDNVTGAVVETRTLIPLDTLVSGSPFARPDLIKIDTQGYELEILKGGTKTLAAAEFVLLEVSLLDIYRDCPLVGDVIDFMQGHGFVLYDICTLMKRPLDGALFQSDFLFVKKTSPFRSDRRWY